MPELAEVEYHRKQWDPFIGRSARVAQLNPRARIFREVDPDHLVANIEGRRLLKSLRHGKRIRFDFAGGSRLGIQLGMTGAMRMADLSEREALDRHDHLVLETEDRLFVFRDSRMFGLVRFSAKGEELTWWPEGSPDVGDERYSRDFMLSFLERRGGAILKNVLLDQEGFPGVGNWMADEICWRAEILPSVRCRELSDAQKESLYVSVRAVSDDALRVIGHDYSTPPPEWLFTHRWKDGGLCPLPRCHGEPLVRQKIAGRTACFCRACQTEAG